jgi:serine/threonine-protein kinase
MVPKKIDRYEVLNELGRGGMGTVYRAFDPRFKRNVAIKVLPREFLHDPTFRARFNREAQTIATLEHPAIVPVYDFGEDSGQPYLVMRYMPGGSLSDRLKKGPLIVAEASQILTRLASALGRAHQKGVIHRDLKPQNILFDPYHSAFLSDFGSAHIVQASTALTGDGIIGTPAYMSPEQARGDDELDGRSDIYALGAILFEMLTGKQPYEADTPMGVAVKHITEPVPRILEVKADLPPVLEEIISRAMAKVAGDRYATPMEMAAALTATFQPASAWNDVPEKGDERDLNKDLLKPDPLVGAPATQAFSTPAGQAVSVVEDDPWISEPVAIRPGAKNILGIPRWIWVVASLILVSGVCGLVAIGGGTAAVLRNLSNPTGGGQSTVSPTIALERILFQDDFTNSSSGWDRYSGEDAITDYAPGGYRIFINDENAYFWSNPYVYLTDVIIEVSATKNGGPDDNDFGLICRYQDPGNYYFFLITSDGYYSINKYQEGELEIVGRESYTFDEGIRQGTATNLLEASCIGDLLTLSVNGNLLYEVRDSDFTAGDVGLIAGTFAEPGTDILFKNFIVKRPEK